MILMGDEVRRTQLGNNNPYCHDSELTWFDWSLVDKHRGVHRFVKKLVHFRSNLPLDDHGFSLTEVLRLTPVQWHGVKLNEPDFSHDSHSLTLAFKGLGHWWHLMVNAYTEPLQFELPVLPAKKATRWRQLIDTYKESPEDFHDLPDAPFVEAPQYVIPPHSLALLVAQHKRG